MVQIMAQLDAFQEAEVKHFIAEGEYRHVYDYWRLTSLNRTQLHEPLESSLGYLYPGYFYFHEKKDQQAVHYLLKANDTLPYRN